MKFDGMKFREPIKLVFIACLEPEIQRKLVFRIIIYIGFSTAEVG